ncbi:hypothetical protein BJ741DRAFT_227252 [Chytriomyces cf. hyalinus JEL632]|nr:hypothetical protein BJ741DRAFT_227252 [Chytriomyces cf. hyalinus JEL632]
MMDLHKFYPFIQGNELKICTFRLWIYSTPYMNLGAINSTTSEDDEEVSNLAQLLSRFEVLLGVFALLMLVAMNALILCLNQGDCRALLGQKNLLLSAIILSNVTVVVLDSFCAKTDSFPIVIAVAAAGAIGKTAYISFSWVRTRSILKLESHPRMYAFFYYFCLVVQIGCFAPVFVVAFATGESRTMLIYATDGGSGMLSIALDTYFAILMGKYLMDGVATQLESKCSEFGVSKSYPVVASHQFVASLAFFCAGASYAGAASVEVSDISLASMRIVYGLRALFHFSIFVVIVCLVRMKVKLLFLKNEDYI